MVVIEWILGSLVVLYLLVSIAAAIASHRPMRIPQFVSPGLLGLPQEDVEFESDGLKLGGWWVENPAPKAVVICLHGYFMNRCELAPMANPLYDAGCSCLFIDFRAQGKSEGTRCTFGLDEQADVKAAVEFARARHPGLPVILYGSSMGAAASVFAASKDPDIAEALILDGVYRSLLEAGKGWWVMLGGKPLDFLLRPSVWIGFLMMGVSPARASVEHAFDNIAGKPILLLYGTNDPIVPKASAEACLKAAGENAELVWFEGGGHGHGRFQQPDLYRDSVLQFISGLGEPSDPLESVASGAAPDHN
jgi:alpha-beta hydrolase superfamily lysophospholipase